MHSIRDTFAPRRERRRDRNIILRASDHERDALRARALARGLSLSDYLRSLVAADLDEHPTSRDRD
jgi:hypothetical protein